MALLFSFPLLPPLSSPPSFPPSPPSVGQAVRYLWDDYLERDDISGIVFVVDSADLERMEEAREVCIDEN